MGDFAKGNFIRELLKLLRACDSMEVKTEKYLSAEHMGLRQVYRWLKALDAEKMIRSFDRLPSMCSPQGLVGAGLSFVTLKITPPFHIPYSYLNFHQTLQTEQVSASPN
jgi:hypothetical protein